MRVPVCGIHTEDRAFPHRVLLLYAGEELRHGLFISKRKRYQQLRDRSRNAHL